MTMRTVSRLASMPGIRAICGALAAAACAGALAACGGDDEGGPIPQEAGNQLIEQLDQVEALVEQRSCDDAQQVAQSFAAGVEQLPAEVDGELRDRLTQASENLVSLTQDSDQCAEPPTGPTGETGVTPPETTEETTTDDTTTDETTTTDEEQPPPDEDQGDDEGGGPPEDTPGNGDPGGGNGSGEQEEDFSGGIGSDG
jgi:hypothetical protein